MITQLQTRPKIRQRPHQLWLATQATAAVIALCIPMVGCSPSQTTVNGDVGDLRDDGDEGNPSGGGDDGNASGGDDDGNLSDIEVTADLAPPTEALTGADIDAAAGTCAMLGGCRLRLV